MSLKTLGAAGLVLAVLLFLLAAAQPATVAESSTACVDSTYYQDCSTVSYERPNPQRAQLFSAAGVVFVLSLVTYGVGAARSSGDGSGGGDGPQPGTASVDPGGTDTLREQLAARQSERGGDAVSAEATAGATERANSPPAAGTAAAEAEPESSELAGTDAEYGRDRDALVSPTAGVVGSALASAFVLGWLLDWVIHVDSAVAQALLFALFAVPGVALYHRYGGAGRTPEVND